MENEKLRTDHYPPSTEPKATGGIAPFGYRWSNGLLVVDEKEVQTRKLIYELFIKHKRKKTVARLLNDLGYRTRKGSLFSDTTIDRLLRDTTAKGIRIENNREVQIEAIITKDLWEQANNFLGQKQTKPPIHLFVGLANCDCGDKMMIPSSLEKYVCLNCKRKIIASDLEEIFVSQIGQVGNDLQAQWQYLNLREKRIIIEQLINKIIIGATEVQIEFAFQAHSFKAVAFSQQNAGSNESSKSEATEPKQTNLNEPLMNEIEAAKFLGISRMTLLRKRNAKEIGFYRVGFRVLYSKEKHLTPFLNKCEK